jgi:opacity protein-like surface antigen
MFSGTQVDRVAGIKPTAQASAVIMINPILAGTVALILFSGTAAQAQCTVAGLEGLSKNAPVVAQAAGMAVTNVSASVGALVTSINSVNTAFLTQSSAFIASPDNPQPDQQGGGVWARGVGGHLSTNTTATAGNISFGGLQQGSITCNTRTLEDFTGVQLGADIARLNVNGWNLHAGTTVGYLGAQTRDGTPGLDPPASFRDGLQIPFAGVYGAASYGRILVDGQVRGDFFQNEVSDDNHGIAGERFDARGISLTGNVAYHHDIENRWFIEPSAGIIWSRTHIDSLNVPGTGVVGTPVGPGFVPPWLLTINDIESTLGRLSVRAGTVVTSDNVVWQPFASASVFHEFQGGIASRLTSDFSALGSPYSSLPTLSSTVSTSNLGTYGQFGLGFTARVVDTGWISYLRGDYRRGDNIEGWSVNGGLRYQFDPAPVAGGPESAIAKAAIYKAPPQQAAYNWNGFYIGAYLGADWGHMNWRFLDDGATVDLHFAGLLGGGEIGYNYQVGKWVFGVEGDVGGTHIRGAQTCPNGFFYDCEMNYNWVSTATARIGYAYWDRLLPYVKGGLVIGQDRAQSVCDTNSRPTISTVTLVGCPSQGDPKTLAGWTLGGGYEFGLTQNVSVKSEIMYVDLGSNRSVVAGIPIDIQRNGFMSTIGLHFRFGG